MPRAKGGAKTRHRRKKILKKAKGYFGGRRKLYKTAAETVLRAGAFAYRGRKQKKRRARALWIVRINAACRQGGLSYSTFMAALKKAGSFDNEKLREALATLDITTMYGRYKVDAKGMNSHEGITFQILRGQRKVVWPDKFAETKAELPMPEWSKR